MPKVIRSYSLDLETVMMIENYCSQEEMSFGGSTMVSRSKLVNDAIKWFMQGDVAELVHGNEQLQKRFSEVMREKREEATEFTESKPSSLPWWRRLLLGR
jgi:hypothetical protein